MSVRRSRIEEASRRAERQLAGLIDDLVLARRMAGLSQAAVARAISVSRGLVAQWEQRRIVPGVVQLVRWGAAVGRDIPLRAHAGDDPLRDVGQLRLLARFHVLIGDAWSLRTEVPVSDDPRDRRAFDAVLANGAHRAAVEAVSRLVDAQGQVRPIVAKQATSGIERVVLILADTRHNRASLAAGAMTIRPAFLCGAREALAALRAGELPRANAVIVV